MGFFEGVKQQIDNLKFTYADIKDSFGDYQTLSGKDKRSILPIVGKALSVLFGTVSESDLDAIQTNVQKLAANQKDIVHVLEQSLSILNVSKLQIKENRLTINKLLISLHAVDDKFQRVTQALEKEILKLEDFIQFYIQINLIAEQVQQMIQKALFALNHLSLQLNMLSLGHLSPSLVTPDNLRSILKKIQVNLPPTLALPKHIDTQLWEFYKFLTCSTIFDKDRILIVVSIPLIDQSELYEIFRPHNLPVPMRIDQDKDVVAQYELEATAIAINKERTNYVLLTDNEVIECSNPITTFCRIRSPIYPVNQNKMCVITLFLRNDKLIDSTCKSIVKLNTTLPLAQYISDGHWVITTTQVLRFSIVCQNASRFSLEVEPPLQVIKLDMTCHAVSDLLSLPAYFQEESHYEIDDPFRRLIGRIDVSNLKLWKPFHDTFENYTLTELPKLLGEVKEIPIDNLLYKLKNLREIDAGNAWPNWLTSLLYFGGFFLGIAIIFICCKFRQKFKNCWSAKFRKSRGSETDATKTVVPMALLQCRSDSHTTDQNILSAPCSHEESKEEITVQDKLNFSNPVRELYPNLCVDSKP